MIPINEDAVWGKDARLRLNSLTGYDGSRTKVPQTARLNILDERSRSQSKI
ncbi:MULTISPECIES: hypothetical protein [Nostocales]|uniref:Uncharacterized protein n=3 Tax=Nostocales TaxID=1161 RepID=A0A8S9SYJ6_9CYAN|nr:hypothetical protein [Tolypothrix bouteillei]KAF3884827.1 hypothetical protein DA73_0400004705 [Tolypothrix bouteillei VB521301]